MSRRNNRRPTMKIKFNTKDQLLDALEAVRPLAESLDAEAVKQHAADEKAYALAWKAACRQAVRYDYATIKAEGFKIPMPANLSKPECPVPFTERLAKVLHMVNLTHQQTFTVDDSGWGVERDLFVLLTLDAPTVKAVC